MHSLLGEQMRHYVVSALAAIVLTGILYAQDDRPGDAPYVPTKLEWAALELETDYGVRYSPGHHVSVHFIATADGRTIECMIQYAPTVSAVEIKFERDSARMQIDEYAKSHHWEWLRLQFKEIVSPD